MIKSNIAKMITVTLAVVFLTACSNPEPPKKELVEVKRGNVTYSSFGINEILVKQAVANSKFTVEQRGDSIVVVMPVNSSFNKKRPDVLLPSTLTPLTKIAKLINQDTSKVMVIVGHTDASADIAVSNKLSLQRAKSVGTVFSVAGLSQSRVFTAGLGASQPCASNGTQKGRLLNQRVELIIAPKTAGDIAQIPSLYAVTNF